MKDLKGKVAVVTGGASGIGRAMAERFATEGMKVVLADIEEGALAAAEGEMKAKGATVASKRTDVSRGEDVEALARFTVDTFGAVHVACNNAGVGVGGVTWQQTVKDWEWVLGVNLWGVIHGIRAFVPIMLQQGDECHVVNTASRAGLATRPWLAMYSASKHAVVALSESLYHELSLTGSKVKVSVLCPAVVNTRIGESERNRPETLRDAAGAGVPVQQAQAMEQAFRALLATGQPPEEVAAAVVEAIRGERFYIIPHEETKAWVATRLNDIIGDRNPTLLT
ncbi:MAG TPA: SDR family NAD(P)-dependent oxidoreductase [Dehalococcoidia bacterium]|nr:SDR family NAD(P)-dependent oxidoreductase [Dehalococcoidia bacterium]